MRNSHSELFVPSEGIYLLNHSVGRPPNSTRSALFEGFLVPWESAGENVWEHWLIAIDEFREALAELLNGHKSDFCPQVNLSSALTKIIASLAPSESKPTILYTEQEFPSIAFVLQQAVKQGYQLKMLPNHLDTLDAAVWSEHLSADVAIVLLTQVYSNSGQQLPIREICAQAHKRDIITVVDVAQSAGVVPIDLTVWQADFVIGSCVKWLCGGPGAGFLWVAPGRLASCRPTDVGWFSHQDPFEFDSRSFRYADDALRFWGGTPSVAPFITAANSIRLITQIGIAQIRAHNLRLTEKIINATDANQRVTPSRPEQRGGTVVLHYPAQKTPLVCARLRHAGIHFDLRQLGIRLSPHIYNSDQEIETLCALL